jgi:hypothetical protein
MAIEPALRNVLEIVGDLSNQDVNANIVDTSVAQHDKVPSSTQVYDCLEELESLGLIKMLQPVPRLKEKKDDQTFKLLNITERGLQELQSNLLKIE